MHTKGRLVCVWSPLLHREGCTTTAIAAGLLLHCYTGKKTLILDKGNSLSRMEAYIAKDIEVKYGLDNIKVFDSSIRTEHIDAYATQISKGLYMLAGSRLDREITGEGGSFEGQFLERCLEGYELVVADLDTGVREESRLYLDAADAIIAVTVPNDVLLSRIFERPGMEDDKRYIKDEKAIVVFNKLYEGWDICRLVDKLKRKYGIENAFGVVYDGNVLNACSLSLNFYSFMQEEMKKRKPGYIMQMTEICSYISDMLNLKEEPEKTVSRQSFIGKLLKAGMF